MAFTGTPVVTKIADNLFLVTGADLVLAGDASGTIGFSDKTVAAEVSLVAPSWTPYTIDDDAAVSLINAIQVMINVRTDVTAAVPISVVKSGTSHADFVITLHNDSAATVSGVLEIYIRYH
jgi:hypothetical protein